MKHSRFLRVAAAAAILVLTTVRPASAGEDLVPTLARQAAGLRPDVLRLALESSRAAAAKGLVRRSDLLTVIDYSIPSTEPRLFTFDLGSRRLLFRELVAHGSGSGGNVPRTFSNYEGTHQTSLGLFVTESTYVGSNGYSLRMNGLEPGVNDNARSRAIVIHGAPYVNAETAKKQGRLGRSWGCPAVRPEITRQFIDTIKGGSAVFAYYPDRDWLASSRFLSDGAVLAAGM